MISPFHSYYPTTTTYIATYSVPASGTPRPFSVPSTIAACTLYQYTTQSQSVHALTRTEMRNACRSHGDPDRDIHFCSHSTDSTVLQALPMST